MLDMYTNHVHYSLTIDCAYYVKNTIWAFNCLSNLGNRAFPHITLVADTFEALFRLCADSDPAVHQATTFLDNLIKARVLKSFPSVMLLFIFECCAISI